MKILIACEFSGTVRDAFISQGHDAFSCDLLPTDKPGPHYQCNVLDILDLNWDLMVAHPPCRHLAVSGSKYFKYKKDLQIESIDFVLKLMRAPIPRIAIENPLSIISSRIRKCDQMVQPWQFGHGEKKATCFWLKNLPKLKPTKIVPGREPRLHHLPPSKDRWKIRSKTYPGIAQAIAKQWGNSNPIQLSLF